MFYLKENTNTTNVKSSKVLKKKMKNSIFKWGKKYSNDKWFLKKLIVKTQVCKNIVSLYICMASKGLKEISTETNH